MLNILRLDEMSDLIGVSYPNGQIFQLFDDDVPFFRDLSRRTKKICEVCNTAKYLDSRGNVAVTSCNDCGNIELHGDYVDEILS